MYSNNFGWGKIPFINFSSIFNVQAETNIEIQIVQFAEMCHPQQFESKFSNVDRGITFQLIKNK